MYKMLYSLVDLQTEHLKIREVEGAMKTVKSLTGGERLKVVNNEGFTVVMIRENE